MSSTWQLELGPGSTLHAVRLNPELVVGTGIGYSISKGSVFSWWLHRGWRNPLKLVRRLLVWFPILQSLVAFQYFWGKRNSELYGCIPHRINSLCLLVLDAGPRHLAVDCQPPVR